MRLESRHKITISLTLLFSIACYYFIDAKVAYYFYQHENSSLHQASAYLTNLGYSTYYLITLAIAGIGFYIFKQKRSAFNCGFLWLCIVIPGLICDILKPLLGRARPVELFTHNIYGLQFLKDSSNFYSMPSGHTTTIMGLCFGISILWPRARIPALILGVSVALTRIILARHYISDVIIAMLLSYLCIHGLANPSFFIPRPLLGVQRQDKIAVSRKRFRLN